MYSTADALPMIASQVQAACCCGLGATRTQGVPGEGSAEAKILLIGEGPGKNEDEQGRPFVGAAGKFLNEMLGSIGLNREDIFITNVVKCRPPGNRDPLPAEVAACWPYLERQLAIIQPQIIVLLGRHSLERFLPGLRISEVHGQPKRKAKQVYFPLYHPAAALYNPLLKETLLQDFKKLPKVLELIEQGNGRMNPSS